MTEARHATAQTVAQTYLDRQAFEVHTTALTVDGVPLRWQSVVWQIDPHRFRLFQFERFTTSTATQEAAEAEHAALVASLQQREPLSPLGVPMPDATHADACAFLDAEAVGTYELSEARQEAVLRQMLATIFDLLEQHNAS